MGEGSNMSVKRSKAVFLSHSDADKLIAEKVIDFLNMAMGLSVHRTSRVHPGGYLSGAGVDK